jgi:hypothetical protein
MNNKRKMKKKIKKICIIAKVKYIVCI